MFFKHYKELSLDCRELLGAANVLNVTEFRLFELAYRDWFGRTGGEAELESLYALYWFTGVTPTWVRHYCRQILALSNQIGHEVQSIPVSRKSAFESITLWCLGLSMVLLATVI